MRLSLGLKIAWRYLFSKKSHNAVNIITGVALCTTAVATAAIVIVLSVFNGFKELATTRYAKIDAPLKIVNISQTPFDADSLGAVIAHIRGIGQIHKVITTEAYADAGSQRALVKLRGVDTDYFNSLGVADLIIDGVPYVGDTLDTTWGVMGSALAVNLQVRPGRLAPVKLMVPRRKGRLNPASLLAEFRSHSINVSGVLEANDERIDRSVFLIPVEAAQTLAGLMPGQATSLEIFTEKGFQKKHLDRLLDPDEFVALDLHQQNAEAFKIINIEKWVSFSLLAFILVIASLNIVSALSMLIIEKRPNMGILGAMGCTRAQIKHIFVAEGFLLSLFGGLAGCVVGAILVLAQQWFGIVKLSFDIDPAVLAIDHYPVQLRPTDFIFVVLLIAALSLATTWLAVVSYNTKTTK